MEQLPRLLPLSEKEMLETTGGNSLAEDLLNLAAKTTQGILEFSRQAIGFQSSLSSNLKK